MREKTQELLEDVKKQGILYLFHHADPAAVMLSMEEFQRIHELLEDHLDEMEAKKLSRETRGKGIPLAKIIVKYKKNTRV